MKRAALYCRFSTVDQHPETQMSGLRQFAANKGLTVVAEYTDHGYCGARARRPELDRMMDDARRHKFDVLLAWACDRLARSTKHLLQTIDELNGMGIQFFSQRKAIDTEGPLGKCLCQPTEAEYTSFYNCAVCRGDKRPGKRITQMVSATGGVAYLWARTVSISFGSNTIWIAINPPGQSMNGQPRSLLSI